MRRVWLVLTALWAGSILALSDPALAGGRAALVIGNAAYRSVAPLANAVNDAEDMAAALARLGYAVTLVRDGDLRATNDGIRAFLRAADHADSAVIFYSGHGVQVNGRNYLVPVDALVADELDLDTQTVALDKLLGLVDAAAPRVKIVILDSCRDNPLVRTLTRGGGTRGLARIDLDAASAKGTLIAFSTAPGAVAQDGQGRNSPFTAALLAHVETPGLDIRQMFGQVRADVDQATQGGQTPWVNEAIVGSFALAGAVGEAGKVAVLPQTVPQQSQPASVTPAAAMPPAEEPARQLAGFIIPDSDRRLLGPEDLAGLSAAELRVARNEIFARRGRFMKDEALRAYFSQFPWYSPHTWNPALSPVEKANVALIQQAERNR